MRLFCLFLTGCSRCSLVVFDQTPAPVVDAGPDDAPDAGPHRFSIPSSSIARRFRISQLEKPHRRPSAFAIPNARRASSLRIAVQAARSDGSSQKIRSRHRTTTGTGDVDKHTFAEIRALALRTNGMAGDFSCEKVPTLVELLQRRRRQHHRAVRLLGHAVHGAHAELFFHALSREEIGNTKIVALAERSSGEIACGAFDDVPWVGHHEAAMLVAARTTRNFGRDDDIEAARTSTYRSPKISIVPWLGSSFRSSEVFRDDLLGCRERALDRFGYSNGLQHGPLVRLAQGWTDQLVSVAAPRNRFFKKRRPPPPSNVILEGAGPIAVFSAHSIWMRK